jgi:hypothetical protein
VIERQVAVLQLLEVAQHLVFGMVRVEYRMREDGVLAQQGGRQGRVGLLQLLVERREVGGDAGDQLEQSRDVGACGLLIDRDAKYAGRYLAQVVASFDRGLVGAQRMAAEVDAQAVEKVPAEDGDSGAPQSLGENRARRWMRPAMLRRPCGP